MGAEESKPSAENPEDGGGTPDPPSRRSRKPDSPSGSSASSSSGDSSDSAGSGGGGSGGGGRGGRGDGGGDAGVRRRPAHDAGGRGGGEPKRSGEAKSDDDDSLEKRSRRPELNDPHRGARSSGGFSIARTADDTAVVSPTSMIDQPVEDDEKIKESLYQEYIGKRFKGSPALLKANKYLTWTRIGLLSLEVLLLAIILVVNFQGFRCFLVPQVPNVPLQCSTYSRVRTGVNPNTFDYDPDGFCTSTALTSCGTLSNLATCTDLLSNSTITTVNGTATYTRRQIASAYDSLFGSGKKLKNQAFKYESRLSTTNVVYAKLFLIVIIGLFLAIAQRMKPLNPFRRYLKWLANFTLFGTSVLSGFLLRWGRGFREVVCSDLFKGSDNAIFLSDCETLTQTCALAIINVFPARNSFRGPAGIIAVASLFHLSIILAKFFIGVKAKANAEEAIERERIERGPEDDDDVGEQVSWTPEGPSAAERKLSVSHAKILPPPGGGATRP